MENQVLILEPDPAIAARLETALIFHGQYQPQKVSSLHAACRLLTEQRFALAIIPAIDANLRAQSMRALQTDLPIVLTSPNEVYESQPVDFSQYQGYLSLDNLEKELPAILIPARWQRDQQIDNSIDFRFIDDIFSKNNLNDICRSVQLDSSVQQVILSRNVDFVTCGWVEDDQRARDVVNRINKSWDGGVRSTQLQFFQIDDEDTPSMLYTRLVGGYLLTLVARHDASIPVIRSQSDQLTAEMTGRPVNESPVLQRRHPLVETETLKEEITRVTYALVIWPVEPLPGSLQKFVVATIEQLARETNCDLKNLTVRDDQLQILVELPAGRPSSWFAKIVKDGVKREIHNQFGLSLELWASGFYASQADHPLSQTELSLLNRSQ